MTPYTVFLADSAGTVRAVTVDAFGWSEAAATAERDLPGWVATGVTDDIAVSVTASLPLAPAGAYPYL